MGNITHLLSVIFVQPLLNLLFLIYGLLPGHDFGMAVIIMTAIIRFALWPLTAKQLHSQKKMQALQPEIAKLKKQAKGDKQLESQMLMELYKEKEISPFSACLPALLQFPFLIALYFVFREATQNPSQVVNMLYAPIQHMSYIQSLIANPQNFNPTLFGLVNMAKPSIALAIIAGITQYIQVKMITPRQVEGMKDPQTQATQMMNYIFPAVTVFIAWKLPAALPLYWTVTNVITIAQQKLILDQEVEKMEEVKVVSRNSFSSRAQKLLTGKPKSNSVKTKKTTSSPQKKSTPKKGKKK